MDILSGMRREISQIYPPILFAKNHQVKYCLILEIYSGINQIYSYSSAQENKIKIKQYIIGTVPKLNTKNVIEIYKIDTPYTHIDDRSFSELGTEKGFENNFILYNKLV